MLCCEICDCPQSSAKSYYWHLRVDHRSSHDEAFDQVGLTISMREGRYVEYRKMFEPGTAVKWEGLREGLRRHDETL